MSGPMISAGLVGCGEIAVKHLDAARLAPASGPGLRFEALTDVDAARATGLGSRFAVYDCGSLPVMLSLPIELVSVCTPNSTHAEIAVRCLEAGKHVLLEHPMALASAEVDQLRAVCEKTQRQLFVVRQRRYTRTIQALRQAIADRALGEIEEAELSLAWNREAEYFKAREWRAARLGGGVLINQASHFLDILLYLLGDVERAAGNIGQVRHAVECEDTACGTLNFVSGARARFELTVAAPKGHNTTSLKLTTRAGVVQVGGRQLDEFVGEVPRELRLLDESEIDTTRGDHAGYMRRVARRIAGDPSAEVVGVEEGARMVRLLETLHTSLGRDDQGLRAWFADRFAGAA